MYEACTNGTTQSPIDLSISNSELDSFSVTVQYSEEEQIPFVNTGHTVQVNYVSASGPNVVLLDSLDVFFLSQFHFHTPSENTINGVHFDMEIHFVHSSIRGETMVLGVFFEINDIEDCEFLSQLEPYIPLNEGDSNPIYITNLLSFPESTNYFAFMGSLTTPPCTEGILWLVKSEPIQCSTNQIDSFKKVIGESNRPIQQLNSRTVLYKY